MSRSSRLSRLALWAVVCALLLKAAVPMLAATAAQMRGLPVAAVCDVYGVALTNGSHGAHEHHAHHAEHPGNGEHDSHAAGHSGDHCALTALAALALPDALVLGVPPAHRAVSDIAPVRSIEFRDASAAWVARLKHGPPPFA